MSAPVGRGRLPRFVAAGLGLALVATGFFVVRGWPAIEARYWLWRASRDRAGAPSFAIVRAAGLLGPAHPGLRACLQIGPGDLAVAFPAAAGGRAGGVDPLAVEVENVSGRLLVLYGAEVMVTGLSWPEARTDDIEQEVEPVARGFALRPRERAWIHGGAAAAATAPSRVPRDAEVAIQLANDVLLDGDVQFTDETLSAVPRMRWAIYARARLPVTASAEPAR